MPTNLYGPGDNFHAENAYVVRALIRHIHEAKSTEAAEVVIWGSGKPLREFLHVRDLASACVHLMELPEESYWSQATEMRSHINIGSGEEVSIAELAHTIGGITGYRGRVLFDTSKSDGTPRKLLDSARLAGLGWTPSIKLKEVLREVYTWYLQNESDTRI